MKVTVQITKGDLIKAGPYTDCFDCLMATALKRKGLDVRSANSACATLEDGTVLKPNKPIDSDALTLPFPYDGNYKPELVGKRFTFTSSWL